MVLMLSSPRCLMLLLALVASSSVGCGSATQAREGVLRIAASFYPLEWMAQQVGGDRVAVSSLTEPGAEPHDLELTASDVAELEKADVVLYLGGFQPALDDALEQVAEGVRFDVAGPARLEPTSSSIIAGKRDAEGAGTVDPHFWLDPVRLAAVGDAFAEHLAAIDGDGPGSFTANAQKFGRVLHGLDRTIAAGLASCRNSNLVTSHNAFGYLARRYGLKQVGITGLSPEDEPTPGDLASVADFVEDNQVATIYFETLAPSAVADAVARETGAQTAVLDPIEGLDDGSAGRDYIGIMRANLAALERGQPCP